MRTHKDCGSQEATLGTSRRFVIATAAGMALLPAAGPARAESSIGPVQAEDENFMRMALEEASHGDFPFGTVIVREGKVIAVGRNLGRTNDDPTAHGEMVAIRRCLADHGSASLVGSTLYTSGEPCAMCMGAIIWCGFGRLVFAASVQQLSTKIGQIMISGADLANRASFINISITGGLMAEEELKLFAK